MNVRILTVVVSLMLIFAYTGCFFIQTQNKFLVTVSAYFGEAYVIRNDKKIPVHLRLQLELGMSWRLLVMIVTFNYYFMPVLR